MDRTTQRLMMGRQQSAVGQVEWTTPGIYYWTVPYNVYSISALLIGATGGGGTSLSFARSGAASGGLRYAIYIPVIPGEVLEVEIGAGGAAANLTSETGGTGGVSAIRRGGVNLLFANGGHGSPTPSSGLAALGGTGTPFSSNVGGGDGGDGGIALTSYESGAGGGGAAGYAGKGGKGADNYLGAAATAGAGGAGGGIPTIGTASYGGGAQGGGVGIYGQGSSGAAGTNGASGTPAIGGGAGSNGTNGANADINGGGGSSAGLYGGAPGGSEMGAVPRAGRGGACRIIHGEGRFYPSTRTANE